MHKIKLCCLYYVIIFKYFKFIEEWSGVCMIRGVGDNSNGWIV